MSDAPAAGSPSTIARRPAIAVGVCIVAMAVYLVARDVLDGPVEIPLSIGLVVLTLGVAVWAGASAADLGVAPRDLGSGTVWGLVAGLVLAAAIVVGSFIPLLDDFFEDDRYADLGGGDLAFEALVRVPIGTALFEEVLFRGALLGLALMLTGRMLAIITSSIVFGFWHVFAAADFADRNDGAESTVLLAVVAMTVLATGAAGVGFAWLRLRSRSVLAPTIVHAAVNSTALLAAASASS